MELVRRGKKTEKLSVAGSVDKSSIGSNRNFNRVPSKHRWKAQADRSSYKDESDDESEYATESVKALDRPQSFPNLKFTSLNFMFPEERALKKEEEIPRKRVRDMRTALEFEPLAKWFFVDRPEITGKRQKKTEIRWLPTLSIPEYIAEKKWIAEKNKPQVWNYERILRKKQLRSVEFAEKLWSKEKKIGYAKKYMLLNVKNSPGASNNHGNSNLRRQISSKSGLSSKTSATKPLENASNQHPHQEMKKNRKKKENKIKRKKTLIDKGAGTLRRGIKSMKRKNTMKNHGAQNKELHDKYEKFFATYAANSKTSFIAMAKEFYKEVEKSFAQLEFDEEDFFDHMISTVTSEEAKVAMESPFFRKTFIASAQLNLVAKLLDKVKYMPCLRRLSYCKLFSKAPEGTTGVEMGMDLIETFIDMMLKPGTDILTKLEKDLKSGVVWNGLANHLSPEDSKQVGTSVVVALEGNDDQNNTDDDGKQDIIASFRAYFSSTAVRRVTPRVNASMASDFHASEGLYWEVFNEEKNAWVKTEKPAIILPAPFSLASDFLLKPQKFYMFQKLRWSEQYYVSQNCLMVAAVVNCNVKYAKLIEKLAIPDVLRDVPKFYMTYKISHEFNETRQSQTSTNHALYSKFKGDSRSKAPGEQKSKLDCLSPLVSAVVRADLHYSRWRGTCSEFCGGHRGKLLLTAIRRQNLDTVKYLLDAGLRVDTFSCTHEVVSLRWALDIPRRRMLRQKLLKQEHEAKKELEEKKTVKKESIKPEVVEENASEYQSDDDQDSHDPFDDRTDFEQEDEEDAEQKKSEDSETKNLRSSKKKKPDRVSKKKPPPPTFLELVENCEAEATDFSLREIDSLCLLEPDHISFVSEFTKETPLSVAVEVVQSEPGKISYKILTHILNQEPKIHDLHFSALRACLPVLSTVAKTAIQRNRTLEQKLREAAALDAQRKAQRVRGNWWQRTLGFFFGRKALKDVPLKEANEDQKAKNGTAEKQKKRSHHLLKLIESKPKIADARLESYHELRCFQVILQLSDNVMSKNPSLGSTKISTKAWLILESLKREQWNVVRYLAPCVIEKKQAGSRSPLDERDSRGTGISNISGTTGTFFQRITVVRQSTADVLERVIEILIYDLARLWPLGELMSKADALQKPKQEKLTSNSKCLDFGTSFARTLRSIFFIMVEYNITLRDEQWRSVHTSIIRHIKLNCELRAGERDIFLQFFASHQTKQSLGLSSGYKNGKRTLASITSTSAGGFRRNAKLSILALRDNVRTKKSAQVKRLLKAYVLAAVSADLSQVVDIIVDDGKILKQIVDDELLKKCMGMICGVRQQSHLIDYMVDLMTKKNYPRKPSLSLRKSSTPRLQSRIVAIDALRSEILDDQLKSVMTNTIGTSSKLGNIQVIHELLNLGAVPPNESLFYFFTWMLQNPIPGDEEHYQMHTAFFHYHPLITFKVFQELKDMVIKTLSQNDDENFVAIALDYLIRRLSPEGANSNFKSYWLPCIADFVNQLELRVFQHLSHDIQDILTSKLIPLQKSLNDLQTTTFEQAGSDQVYRIRIGDVRFHRLSFNYEEDTMEDFVESEDDMLASISQLDSKLLALGDDTE